jgi:phosphate transport system substrate-binding protein
MARARHLALVAASAALAAGTLAVAGCGGDDDSSAADAGAAAATAATSDVAGTIAGAGASSQDAAMEAWIAGFQRANPGATVSYDPVGSGGGREQFVAGGTVFGGTDAHLADDELTAAQERCGGVDNLIEIPVYVSPIAIAFNLPGVDALNLSPETLARIMKREITTWNDPAIVADNPGADLPDTEITTVSRSDESGTTENVQQYLAAVAPKVWTYEVDGNWPVKGGESAQGTSGVVDAIGAGEGTIGYADASQVADLGVARIKVGADFVPPSAKAAAAILEESPETDDPGAHVVTYDLKRDTSAQGTYPIVLVSYEMACTRYAKAQDAAVVKPFLSWIISPEGQEVAASAAGSAPLSAAIRSAIQPAVDAIQG